MAITPEDLGGDENLARRILVRARAIAPCIDSFAEGSEQKKNAIAILKGVMAEVPAPGSKRTRSLSRNGTSMTFDTVGSAFDGDARADLRALCGAATASGHSVGSFPEGRTVERIWPEGRYSS